MAARVELNTMGSQPSDSFVHSEKKGHLTWKKVDQYFATFRDVLWSYIKNSYQIARRGMKIVAVKIPRFEPKMLKAIAALGLAHAINTALILSKYPSTVKSFLQNLSIQDIEGVVLSGISLIMNPLDAVDSGITFLTSATTLGLFPVVTVFSIIALPIALALLGYGSLRGVYDLVRLGIHKHQSPKQVKTMEEIQKLKLSLEKKLRVTALEQSKIESKYRGDAEKIDRKIEVLKARKINILTRQTDKKVVNVMTNLLSQLENEPDNLTEINGTLSDLHSLMNRKITVGVIGTCANIAMFTTLAAAAAFPISSLAVPVVALVRHAIVMGKSIYMNHFYTAGLKNPEITKSKVI